MIDLIYKLNPMNNKTKINTIDKININISFLSIISIKL